MNNLREKIAEIIEEHFATHRLKDMSDYGYKYKVSDQILSLFPKFLTQEGIEKI